MKPLLPALLAGKRLGALLKKALALTAYRGLALIALMEAQHDLENQRKAAVVRHSLRTGARQGEHSSEGRASVSCGHKSLSSSQDPLQGTAEKHGARVYVVRPEQSCYRKKQAIELAGPSSVYCVKTG
ncbi:MAG: hypothetical protein ACI8WM_002968 [Burkholderiaceae bacterium]|jgi:hypothetical protein